jgi:hypothetical protein
MCRLNRSPRFFGRFGLFHRGQFWAGFLTDAKVPELGRKFFQRQTHNVVAQETFFVGARIIFRHSMFFEPIFELREKLVVMHFCNFQAKALWLHAPGSRKYGGRHGNKKTNSILLTERAEQFGHIARPSFAEFSRNQLHFVVNTAQRSSIAAAARLTKRLRRRIKRLRVRVLHWVEEARARYFAFFGQLTE